MKSIIAILLASLVSLAHAQTLSPPNAECGKKCVGSFTITNDSDAALVVTVTPYSLGLSEKGVEFHPLDSGVIVKLSTMSARLSPHQVYQVDYKVTCTTYPCAVAFNNTLMMPHKVEVTDANGVKEGVNLRIVLSEALYVCEKSHGCRVGMLDATGYKPQ